MKSHTVPAELHDPPFLSSRTFAVGWFMAWRLTGAILLPGSAITALALAGSSASTLVSPIVVGWYCALTIIIAAGLAINSFAGRWAEREYDRALPDSFWWGVAWRTGPVALLFPSLAISAFATSPMSHRWAWALAGVAGATGLLGSLLMLGWSTALLVHRSLRAAARGPVEEPTGWFDDISVPTVPPYRRPREPKATGAPHATVPTGQSSVPSPAMSLEHPTPIPPHDLSDPRHLTHPAAPSPEPEPLPLAPESGPRGRSPASEDPRPSPLPEGNPVVAAALDPSPSATARPHDGPHDQASVPAPPSLEVQPLPPQQPPVPKRRSAASPPGRPTPVPAGVFQARFWQNIVGGWEVEISYRSAGSSGAKRRVVFRTDRKPRPRGGPPGGFYSRGMAEEFAKARIEQALEILAINQMQRVRRAPRYGIPGGLSATLDPLGGANLEDLTGC